MFGQTRNGSDQQGEQVQTYILHVVVDDQLNNLQLRLDDHFRVHAEVVDYSEQHVPAFSVNQITLVLNQFEDVFQNNRLYVVKFALNNILPRQEKSLLILGLVPLFLVEFQLEILY